MGAETDYLVIGAGAHGLAFVDALVAHADVDVLVVDRRDKPGGHWNDAYPFVRLHQPSAYYGVASLPLGTNALDEDGCYERASGDEVVAYFGEVMERLEATGRVRFLGRHEVAAGTTVRSLTTGDAEDVSVRRAVVDATWLLSEVPATHTPSFSVAEGARCVPAGGVVDVDGPVARWVVLGAGKTAMDTVVWLLTHDVPADRVRWVRPQEPWTIDRTTLQPLERVGELFDGLSREIEAAALAESVDDFFLRMEAAGRVTRIDPDRMPTVFRGPILGAAEMALLRQVTDVVRLGHVQRIESDRMVLEDGEVASEPDTVYVDCTARALSRNPAKPIWEPGRITLQQGRMASPCFNGALIGFLESTDRDDAAKNALVPAHPYPQTDRDWCSNMAYTHRLPGIWATAPDLTAWVAGCRLDLLHSLPEKAGDPLVNDAMVRYMTHLGPALARLEELAKG